MSWALTPIVNHLDVFRFARRISSPSNGCWGEIVSQNRSQTCVRHGVTTRQLYIQIRCKNRMHRNQCVASWIEWKQTICTRRRTPRPNLHIFSIFWIWTSARNQRVFKTKTIIMWCVFQTHTHTQFERTTRFRSHACTTHNRARARRLHKI